MKRQVLYQGASEFSRYQVVDTTYDGRPARVLYGNHDTPQSGVALDDNPELLFDYNQRFYEIALSMQPKRVLVIGGGAFTLPKVLIERLPKCQVDVAELDELLPQLAIQYFGLPQTPRLQVAVEDGRSFLRHTSHQYDLIIIDAFSEFTIPRSLYTRQAAAAYAAVLNDGGVVAMNIISWYRGYRHRLTDEVVASFQTAFKTIHLYPADYTYSEKAEQNIVVVATQQQDPSFDYLQSHEVVFEPDSPVALEDE